MLLGKLLALSALEVKDKGMIVTVPLKKQMFQETLPHSPFWKCVVGHPTFFRIYTAIL